MTLFYMFVVRKSTMKKPNAHVLPLRHTLLKMVPNGVYLERFNNTQNFWGL